MLFISPPARAPDSTSDPIDKIVITSRAQQVHRTGKQRRAAADGAARVVAIHQVINT
jgi:hypothetical protein